MDIKLSKVLTYNKKFQPLLAFDHVTHPRPCDNLKKLYFNYQTTYCQLTWQDANLWDEVHLTNV